MLYDLILSFVAAAMALSAIAVIVYIFFRHPKVLVMFLFVALLLVGLVVAPTVAEELREDKGYITRVAPEMFDGYPVLVVTVETFSGEVYTYYAEEEINVQGEITLLLFGEEVVDVY